MEHESHHHHHPHKTGVRWLDLGLGLAAGIVSLVSLWLGLHSAHSMEKLVASNSYPYVELMRSTSTEYRDGDVMKPARRVRYMLENNGVGPARIEWVQFNFDGKPVGNLTELLQKCCSAEPEEARNLDARGGIAGSLIRPGAMVQMFDWSETATPSPALLALHKQMDKISWSTCYCSVFDDCYVTNSDDDTKPRAIEQCTLPAKTFRPDFPRS
ncbi:hypothetical protein [Massilia suwonensis]|uniref:Uncharacterized protein n=1 Tax=Massilia suwonensis TaxID=648895 RepID=A0ABW0MMS0_9BURK